MKTQISKAYRNGEHYGWKKYLAGTSWFLGSGTSPASEAKAIALAEVLLAKWMLAKAGGATELSKTDFEEAKALLEGRPTWSSARDDGGWLKQAVTAIPKGGDEPSMTAAAIAPPPVQATSSVPEAKPRRWLFASLDEFMSTVMKELKPDRSNGDHVINTCERVRRARDAIQDTPLDQLDRKALDDWLLTFEACPRSKPGGHSMQ